MTPELRKLLEPIGWSVVEKSTPVLAATLLDRLTQFGGRIGATKSESAAIKKTVEAAMKSAFRTIQMLDKLPIHCQDQVNLAREALDALAQIRNGERPNRPASDQTSRAKHELFDLLAALEAVDARLEREARGLSRGNQPNEKSYAFALVVAEIYLVGVGEMPSVGRNAEDWSRLTCSYGRTVQSVAGAMGLQVGDWYRPCETAISRLEAESDRSAA